MMTARDNSPEFPFSDENFSQIAALASSEFGLNIRENKKALVYSRLVGRLRELELNNFNQYCNRLSGDAGESERLVLLSSLTTNVTSFFREEHHFKYLEEVLLPSFLKPDASDHCLRFWSAGCSTGQEPYSLAISILESDLDLERIDIKILASDIDINVLRFAREGVYEEEDLKNMPKSLLQQYFKLQETGSYKIIDDVKELVTFRKLNLMQEWPMSKLFDAIFCRNVAIYFNDCNREKLWSRFAGTLTSNGHLFIGHSERVSGSAQEDLVAIGNTTYSKNSIERDSHRVVVTQ